MKLKPTLLLFLVVMVAVAGSGCSFFKKSKKPKQSTELASETEGDFRQRWIDKRVADLTAAGTEASAAHTQAEAEFREKFPYIRSGKK
jgi:hypothetical protein